MVYLELLDSGLEMTCYELFPARSRLFGINKASCPSESSFYSSISSIRSIRVCLALFSISSFVNSDKVVSDLKI